MEQITDFFARLFDTADWPARWHCGIWSDFHGWLYLISDLMIWAAYFAIPAVIIRFITRKTDPLFTRLYFLFAAFILACGSTHFLDALAFWHPLYRLSALVRFGTGAISWVTVYYIVQYMPIASKLRSHQELEAEIAQRQAAEVTLERLNADLEEKVRARTQDLHQVLESIADGFTAFDSDWNIVYTNVKAAQYSKTTPAELIGKNLLRDIPAFQQSPIRADILAAAKDLKPRVFRNYFPTPQTWLEVSIYPSERGVSILMRDITETVLADQKAKESEFKYRQIVETAQEGIWMIDEHNRTSFANARMAEMLECTPEEILQSTLLDFVDPETREEVESNVAKRKQGVREQHDFQFTTRKGKKIWTLVETNPILLDGEYKGALAMVTDITARKQAEQEIKALNEDLERKIEERTQALIQSNKELEAFSYSVSHDLRAPLRAIHGYARIMEEDYAPQLDDEGLRLLGVIQHNATQMGILIDDLLAFSRLGRKALDKSWIDMKPMAYEVFEELRQSANTQATFTIENFPPLFGDIALIKQVLLNLIGNALKYSSRKEHPIIRLSSNTQGGETVYAIADNGAGFDMKYGDKLFGVFQRLHAAEDFPGTGVGLAIVQRIIQKHGGRIWATGKVDEGATFYFAIPNPDTQSLPPAP